MDSAKQKPVSPRMLRAATKRFFELHWPRTAKEEVPQWARLVETKLSDSVRKGGCYAVLDAEGNVSYVGLGVAKPLKEGAAGGILGRLYRHVVVRKALVGGQLQPKRPVWKEMSGILYIPFGEQAYLAGALELYLIDQFGCALVHNKGRVPRVRESTV